MGGKAWETNEVAGFNGFNGRLAVIFWDDVDLGKCYVYRGGLL